MEYDDTALEPPVNPLLGNSAEDHPQTCYFWIDTRPEEPCMAVMCEKCHAEKMRNVGWKWHGSNGFGPYDYVCELCQKVIHKHETGSKNDTNPSDVQS